MKKAVYIRVNRITASRTERIQNGITTVNKMMKTFTNPLGRHVRAALYAGKTFAGFTFLNAIRRPACAGLVFLLFAASAAQAQTISLEGTWVLDSIRLNNGADIVERSGTVLPEDVYYTCPEKMELQGENEATLHFTNMEIKKANYSFYTHQNNEYLHFSFPGTGSAPERQYSLILKIEENRLVLTYSDSSDRYVYYYSAIKTNEL
jgi:hypothetical protein